MKKKIVFTGIILVLVMMFAVTCDTPADTEVEYTDVVYSPNGSEVTLYLDGRGVPVTPAQRAINKDLATMAYDFFEVIFIGGTYGATSIARTSWELGQPAGIADVPRGSGTTGINYIYDTNKAGGTSGTGDDATKINIACMFVGKKSDKTLLGIGFISSTTQQPNGTVPSGTGTSVASVNSTTASVTFSIAAIQTGLLVGTAGTTESIEGGTTNPVTGVRFDSFKYVASSVTTPVTYANRNPDNSTRSSVNGSPLKYPRYSLPQVDDATVNATYEFAHVNTTSVTTAAGGTADYFKFARVINTDVAPASPVVYPAIFRDRPLAQKRVPRFMSGGRYMEPKEGWTTTTSVNFFATGGTPSVADYTGPGSGAAAGTNNTQFNPLIGLQFKVKGSGVFSFYLQIPVYMITSETGTYGGSSVAATKWYIRTGVGSELYSLDDGAANGGCVFMSVGASAGNWLDIEWQWI